MIDPPEGASRVALTDPYVVILASAGTGKTFQLTNRYLTLLRSGSPERILASTFTRKAATELRERVRTALIEKGEFALANSIGQARIGTVNSVCGGYLERFAFEAGLATEQRVLEEAQSGALVREAIDRVSDSASVQELVELSFGHVGLDWRQYVKTDPAFLRPAPRPARRRSSATSRITIPCRAHTPPHQRNRGYTSSSLPPFTGPHGSSR